MSPCAVVIALDLLKDLGPGCLSCGQRITVDGLLFERGKEAFGHCVIPAISLAAHALRGFKSAHLLDEGSAAILTPLSV